MGDYKFQSLYVYQLSLKYTDKIYEIVSALPNRERFNLSSQLSAIRGNRDPYRSAYR